MYIFGGGDSGAFDVGLHFGSAATKGDSIDSVYEMDGKFCVGGNISDIAFLQWREKLRVNIFDILFVYFGGDGGFSVQFGGDKG